MDDVNKEINFVSISDLKESRIFFEMNLPNVAKKAFICILSVLILSFLYILIARYDVIVHGTVITRPSQEISYVIPLLDGNIVEKKFKNGEYVKKDQILYVLNNSYIIEEIEKNTKQANSINEKLTKKKFVNSYLINYENGQKNTGDFDIDIEVIKHNLEKLELEYSNAKNIYETEMKLYPTYTSKKNIEDYKRNMDIAEINLHNYIKENIKENTELISEYNLELEELNASKQKLEYELSITSIKASQEGCIEEIIRLNEGDAVIAENRIAKIIPAKNEKLKVLITVNSNEVAEIENGMTFKVRFPKYPISEFNKISGIVIQVPHDSSVETTGITNFQMQGELDSNFIQRRADNKRVEIIPGMTGSCDILIRKEPIYLFLLKKLQIC